MLTNNPSTVSDGCSEHPLFTLSQRRADLLNECGRLRSELNWIPRVTPSPLSAVALGCEHPALTGLIEGLQHSRDAVCLAFSNLAGILSLNLEEITQLQNATEASQQALAKDLISQQLGIAPGDLVTPKFGPKFLFETFELADGCTSHQWLSMTGRRPVASGKIGRRLGGQHVCLQLEAPL